MAHVHENLKSQEVGASIEDKWFCLKKCLLESSDQTCGWTKQPPRRTREVWWWNDRVDTVSREKKRL